VRRKLKKFENHRHTVSLLFKHTLYFVRASSVISKLMGYLLHFITTFTGKRFNLRYFNLRFIATFFRFCVGAHFRKLQTPNVYSNNERCFSSFFKPTPESHTGTLGILQQYFQTNITQRKNYAVSPWKSGVCLEQKHEK